MSRQLIKCPNCGASTTRDYNPTLVVTCDNCLAEYKPFAPYDGAAPKFTFSSRKPRQNFIEYIQRTLQDRQKEISNADLVKHRNQTVRFYSVYEFKFKDMRPVRQTNPFSDMIMIEIEPNGKKMTIGSEQNKWAYFQVSDMDIGYHEGKALLYWTAMDMSETVYTVVKLMSPDGIIQIKLISKDGKQQDIHSVCELPTNFQLSQWIR